MLNLSRCIFLVHSNSRISGGTASSFIQGDSYGLYSHFDPSMEIAVMVLVCAFFLVGFLSIYFRCCNEPNAVATATAVAVASSGERFWPKGLDQEVIESFPVFIYSYVKDFKMGKGALECSVCLSEFEDDNTLRLLPKCSHVFHPDCIDAWLAYHVTCPVCRAKLTPDSDAKPVQSSSDITELNSNNNNESNPPTAQRVEERNEFVIQVNEETQPRAGEITGKFPRSHSTGHSLIQLGENVERFTLRLPEEIRKQIVKSGKLKRTRSYDMVLGREGSSRKTGSVKSEKGGAGGVDGV